MNLRIQQKKHFWEYDDTQDTFSNGSFRIPLQKFLRFSTVSPWRADELELQKIHAGIGGEKLTVSAQAKSCSVCLRFSFSRDGILLAEADFTAKQKLKNCCFAIAVPIADEAKIVMPMSLYNNNPSTPADRVVPRFPKKGTASLVLEESRYPIPGVNAEEDGNFLSLFAIPGNGLALGAERSKPGETFLLLTSGPVSFNGRHDFAYESKNEAVLHAKGYRDLAKGGTFSFRFALHWGKTPFRGEGFRDLILTGEKLLQPGITRALPLKEVIRRKICALDERFCEDGYLAVAADNIFNRPAHFMYGWAGQCLRLAFDDVRYGVLKKEDFRIQRGLHAAEFFIDHAESNVPGLYHTGYFLNEKEWRPNADLQERVFPARALGETWSDVVRLMLFCKKHKIACPAKFRTAAEKAFRFMLTHLLPCGLPPSKWDESGNAATDLISCAGTSMLPGLFALARLTGKKRDLQQASVFLDRYWKLGGDTFDTPFAHATLDAGCEDKEAAIPFFAAAADAYDLTGDEKFRHYAEASGDWLLSWVYLWDVPLKPDSIAAHYRFHTTGWPSVSIENQHLDVFFPAWEMYQFGKKTGNRHFEHAGEMVFQAWSNSISAGGGDWLFSNPGRQAEQIFQTEWSFPLAGSFRKAPPALRYRMAKFGYTEENIDRRNHLGGVNAWDISWIIALVLDAALGFAEEKQA